MKSRQPPEDDHTVIPTSASEQSPEDDHTVIPTSASEYTKKQASENIEDNALPIGTWLGNFEIIGLIGEGGFGIVYLAFDHSPSKRKVAIKEYMPSGLATRKNGINVVTSKRYPEAFNAGLKSFINEAQLLAKFNHPSLVQVYDFWEANGTAYMVMPFYDGSSLKAILGQRQIKINEVWLKRLLGYLLDALEVIHKENCFHRDISPDNILILKDSGKPVLLDFGAARLVIGKKTQNLTVILKPGYAPIEQYTENDKLKQGAWTDIYALAAVVYFTLTGKAPTASVSRLISDYMKPLGDLKIATDHTELELAREYYSDEFLHAIDKALAVKPQDRPQNIAEFRALLNLSSISNSSTKFSVKEHENKTLSTDKPSRLKANSSFLFSSLAIAIIFALITERWFFLKEGSQPNQEPPPQESKRREELQLNPKVPEGWKRLAPEDEILSKPAPLDKGDLPDKPEDNANNGTTTEPQFSFPDVGKIFPEPHGIMPKIGPQTDPENGDGEENKRFDKENDSQLSANTTTRVARYMTRIHPSSAVVIRGDTIKVISEIDMVKGKNANVRVDEEFILNYPSGRTLTRLRKTVLNNVPSSGKYMNQFTFAPDNRTVTGTYSFKTVLYLNNQKVRESKGKIQVE